MYLHWKSFASDIWKIGKLKGLFRRAFKICSEDEALDKEIKHLKFVFTKINKYPAYIVDKTLKGVQEKIETPITEEVLDSQQNSNNTLDSNVTPRITLPSYKGKEGQKIIQGFKRFLSSTLPQNIKTRFTDRGKR